MIYNYMYGILLYYMYIFARVYIKNNLRTVVSTGGLGNRKIKQVK